MFSSRGVCSSYSPGTRPHLASVACRSSCKRQEQSSWALKLVDEYSSNCSRLESSGSTEMPATMWCSPSCSRIPLISSCKPSTTSRCDSWWRTGRVLTLRDATAKCSVAKVSWTSCSKGETQATTQAPQPLARTPPNNWVSLEVRAAALAPLLSPPPPSAPMTSPKAARPPCNELPPFNAWPSAPTGAWRSLPARSAMTAVACRACRVSMDSSPGLSPRRRWDLTMMRACERADLSPSHAAPKARRLLP
mmetsp:Transcript_90194/g.291880  ORF Transcript_90194/g.291880 Transcript_90194/m.291880 type:complete len:249 (-) Transcript_90194:134-880(-)